MKIILFANTDWNLYNFRLPLAYALKRRGHDVLLVAPAGNHISLLERAGFRCIAFPLSRRGINPFLELFTLIRLIRLYSREKPDLVHHFTIKCVLYGSLAAQITAVKSVFNTITGLGHLFIDQGLLARCLQPLVRMIYRLALQKGTTVFQNDDDRQVFARYGLIRREQSAVIRGSGVNTQYFSPCSKSSEGRPVCVLFAARLLWSKGLGEFIEAAKTLGDGGGKLLFKIAGAPDPGNPASIKEADLKAWAGYHHIEFLGHRDDMKAVLEQADMVVLPSYREGLPRVLLEAAACGLPLIAADVPGCREVVQHGYNGFLIPVKDTRELIQAIWRLAANDSLRRAMGTQSRRLACEQFSEKEIVRKILLLYQQHVSSMGEGSRRLAADAAEQ